MVKTRQIRKKEMILEKKYVLMVEGNVEYSLNFIIFIRRDLSRVLPILELIKLQEETKLEQLHLTIAIFKNRLQNIVSFNHLPTANIKTARYILNANFSLFGMC